MRGTSKNRHLSYSYDYKIAQEGKQIKLVFDELNKENIADVHKFCEDNLLINARDQTFSQPLEYFERATLSASNFRKELSIVAYREGENSSINNGNAEESGSVENKERKIVGFFMGILSSSILSSKQTHPILKFFVIDKSYRRLGLGSFLLKELYRRFKSMGIKGKIEVLCSPPEYWFPGISLKYTPALFWLKKNKFKRYKIPFMRFRQNLYVELDPKNNESIRGYIEKKPPEENNGIIFRRAMVKDREELLEFVKKEFHNIWSLEADMSFKSINFDNEADNSTTFIAIDKISNRIVGFATYNAHFLGSFGPTGVLKSYRGRGIGGLLLKHALYEIKRSGVDRCIILWVVGNTVKYYSKVIGAYIGEVFYPMHGKIKI